MSEWKKVASEEGENRVYSKTWDPARNPNTGAILLKAMPNNCELEGRYIKLKENVGSYGKNIFVIKDKNGDNWDVWEDTVLAERFEKIPVGSDVKIVFKGRDLRKNAKEKHPDALDKKTDYFKNWDVFYKEPEGGVKQEPAQQAQVSNSVAPSGGEDDGLPF